MSEADERNARVLSAELKRQYERLDALEKLMRANAAAIASNQARLLMLETLQGQSMTNVGSGPTRRQ